ncbi:MAG TPA: hypothetical protein VMF09_01915 [Solirubrobacteraceae bacterium]|nr:hypothetical protein [Solirubrobacteraceae bacterium]
MNVLRRLALSRLLLLCALVVAIGVCATALASALTAGPTPPPKPLAQAIHDALAGANAKPIEGISANITFTDRLLEGASLASGGHSGELTSSPLVTGASGRLWASNSGELRVELQSEQGDTQILYAGHSLTVYDAATNTEYRYTPPAQPGARENTEAQAVPSLTKIEAAISDLSRDADLSGATPTDVAGQPAYTVRVSPKQAGSLFGAVELSFDAVQGVPLRAAVYSSDSSAPVIELAATEISYGPVSGSVFELNPPTNVKVEELSLHERDRAGSPGAGAARARGHDGARPKITTFGHGPSTVAVLEAKSSSATRSGEGEALEGLPKVSIDGVSASELRTELGTLLTFERGGVRYLLAGAVPPASVEAVARGL